MCGCSYLGKLDLLQRRGVFGWTQMVVVTRFTSWCHQAYEDRVLAPHWSHLRAISCRFLSHTSTKETCKVLERDGTGVAGAPAQGPTSHHLICQGILEG